MATKGYQFASSAKWVLRENLALQLMECLTPTFTFDIFISNYFTSFRLHTYLRVNNIPAIGVLNRNRMPKMHYYWAQAAAEKELELELAIQSVWVLYRINKISTACFLKRCSHCNFCQIFKGRIITEPCTDSKYPIRCLL